MTSLKQTPKPAVLSSVVPKMKSLHSWATGYANPCFVVQIRKVVFTKICSSKIKNILGSYICRNAPPLSPGHPSVYPRCATRAFQRSCRWGAPRAAGRGLLRDGIPSSLPRNACPQRGDSRSRLPPLRPSPPTRLSVVSFPLVPGF